MAGFADLVRDLVVVADGITSSLQANVTHYAFSGATLDAYGKVTSWGAPFVRTAVVERVYKQVRNAEGTTREAAYSVTFPRPVAIDPRDRLVLPGSVEGPILNVSGVVNPGTAEVYAVEVLLGHNE